MRENLSPIESFFYQHIDPPGIGAMNIAHNLAIAEIWKQNEIKAGRLKIKWITDKATLHELDDDDPAEEVLKCVMTWRQPDNLRIRHSMLGIIDPTDSFKRFLEAEIAQAFFS